MPDGHFLPNRAIASAGGAATGIAADAAALARWGYRLYGGLVLSPERTIEIAPPSPTGTGSAPSSSGTAGRGTSTSDWPVSAPSVTPAFSFPATKTLLLVVPDERLSVAVLTVAPSNVGTIETPILVADLIDACTHTCVLFARRNLNAALRYRRTATSTRR